MRSRVGDDLVTFPRKLIAIALLIVAVAALLCFGVIGVGRGKAIFDSIYLYFAGQTWLQGGNPYHRDELLQTAARAGGSMEYAQRMLPDYFAYPPPVAAFAIPLSLLSEPAARVIVRIVNLIAVGIITALSLYEVYLRGGKEALINRGALIATLAIGNPFTAHTVWLGQTSLVSFAATYAAWLLSRQQRFVLAGICLGISCFKPHTCILVFFWFLLERYWKALVACLGTALLMSIYPVITHGPIQLTLEWLSSVRGYQSTDFNRVSLENDNLIGLGSFLYTLAGIEISSAIAVFVGLICTLILWAYRKRLNQDDVLGILMGIQLVFLFGHTYDYVYLIPIYNSLVLYANQAKVAISVILLILLLFIPQQLVRRLAGALSMPVLSHWRTLVVIIMMLFVIQLSIQAKQKQRSPIVTF